MRFAIAFSVALSALTACKKAPSVSHASYIIGGTDDIETIEGSVRDEIPAAHLNSAVVIAIRLNDSQTKKYCSGTLIDPAGPSENPRIITNHHCFTEGGESTASIPRETIPDPCGNVFVHFGFIKGATAQSALGRCQPGSFRNDFEGDLAVFTLDKAPGAPYKPAKFWQGEVPGGRKARIVHHPMIEDTSRRRQEDVVHDATLGIDLPVAQVTRSNCQTIGLFPQTEWGLDKALGMGIKHTCDQRKGSSGSSLWDVETNTILGINWGGIILSYADSSDSETYNVATRAPYVLAFLDGNLDRMKAEIAMGTALPDREAKIASAGAKTKRALRTGCGMIGHGKSSTHSMILLLVIIACPLFVIIIESFRRRSH